MKGEWETSSMFAPQAHHLTKQHYLYSLMPPFWRYCWNLAPVEWDVLKAKKKVRFSQLALQICQSLPAWHSSARPPLPRTNAAEICFADSSQNNGGVKLFLDVISKTTWIHLVSPYLLGGLEKVSKIYNRTLWIVCSKGFSLIMYAYIHKYADSI